MRYKLRTLGVVTATLTALSLAACSTDGDSEADNASTDNSGDDLSAALIVSTLDNPFFVSVVDGAEQQADEYGIDLDVQNANNSDGTSLDQATTAITKQPDVLILDPVGEESGGTITNNANSSDIPVVAFDREPASGDLASFIGYDAIQAGERGAESLAEAIDEEGTIVEIQGILGTDVAQDRSKGFNVGIEQYSDIEVVAQQSADFDRGEALDVMTNVLQANPDIDGVYAANDEMAMGVVAALNDRGLAGDVMVVGNDGIADALKAVQAGTMYSTHAESPFVLGQSVMDLVDKVAAGEAVEERTVLEGELVTQDDVGEFCEFLEDSGDTDTCAGIE